MINGRGGGKPDMAQGSGDKAQLSPFLATVKDHIIKSL
jgi:alanyl-tRNA synthetase